MKCEFVRGFDFAALYSSCGTLDEKQVSDAVRNRDFSAFPENMAKAAPEAIREYSETSDPQLIDLILDRACLADMLSVARGYKDEVISDYVKNRIDMMNILTALRVLRMGKDSKFFDFASSEGGYIDKKCFRRLFLRARTSFLPSRGKRRSEKDFRRKVSPLFRKRTAFLTERLRKSAKNTSTVFSVRLRLCGICAPLKTRSKIYA